MNTKQRKQQKAFRRAVNREREKLLETLTMGGHLEHITFESAIDEDWVSMLHTEMSDLLEGLRLTAQEEEEERVQVLRRKLARIAAVCERWNEQLEGK